MAEIRAEVRKPGDRHILFLGQTVMAVEGDPCRDPKFPRIWNRESLELMATLLNALVVPRKPAAIAMYSHGYNASGDVFVDFDLLEDGSQEARADFELTGPRTYKVGEWRWHPAGANGIGWAKEPPTEAGCYWHWTGHPDDEPASVLVRRGNSACFVTGKGSDVSCESYGGWWLRMRTPDVPIIRHCEGCGDGFLEQELDDFYLCGECANRDVPTGETK